MSWIYARLKDIATIIMGQSPKSEHFNYEGEGMPFMQGKTEFGKFSPSIVKYTTKTTRVAKNNSILFTVRAPVGALNIANQDICIGRGLASIDSNDGDNYFLYYLIKNHHSLFLSESGEGVYDSINKTNLNNVKLFIPSNIDLRKKIGAILGAYDDLIENNLKRIKLLEKAAQNIYSEWFVNMRFPGHENIPINEETGLPEGWKDSELDSVATVQSSKRVFLADYVDDGVPFFRGKEISQKAKHENVSEPYFISQEKFKEFDSKWGSPKENDILITAVGTIGNCYLVRKSDLPFYFKDGNLLWIHSCNQNISGLYLIQYFQSPIFKGVLNSISIGSSQKALTISAVKKLNITIPDIETLEKFNSIIKPIVKQIEVMTNMMIQLKAARDILLPRLMNRTIEV